MIDSTPTTMRSPLSRYMADLRRVHGDDFVVLDDNARAVLLDSARPASSSTGRNVVGRWESSCEPSSGDSSSSSGQPSQSVGASSTLSSSQSHPPPPPPLVKTMSGAKKPLISPQNISSRKSHQQHGRAQQRKAAASSSRSLPAIPQKSESPLS